MKRNIRETNIFYVLYQSLISFIKFYGILCEMFLIVNFLLFVYLEEGIEQLVSLANFLAKSLSALVG